MPIYIVITVQGKLKIDTYWKIIIKQRIFTMFYIVLVN